MKMQLTKKKTAILALVLISLVAVCFAAYWIYSNIVPVTYMPPQYTLTLAGEQTDDYEITLTATLTVLHFNATETVPVSGATIYFYLTDAEGTIIGEEIGTSVTDEEGEAVYVWAVPFPQSQEPIDYYFIAGYEVTG